MKNIILFFVACCLSLTIQAQVRQAYVNQDGSIGSRVVSKNKTFESETRGVDTLAGWPVRLAANASFKNMRGMAVADLNLNGDLEIIAASASTLYVFTYDGNLLWSKNLSGTAIYPPTVGDMNLDGVPEIALATGGLPAAGRIYLMDANGNDMPGWPLNFSNNWILCSPVMADVDGNDTLELIFNERVSPQGYLHIRKINGSEYSTDWPVLINATPAVTPSVGDIDHDGANEIVLCSYNDILAFSLDGNLKTGFPVQNSNTTFSYESPILADLDNNGYLSIIGSTNGDLPEYYAINYDGSYHNGWPYYVPDASWTYCPPAVADLENNGNFSIFMTRPIGDTTLPMLYGFDKNAALLPNFPVSAQGGDEGIVTIADVDNDGNFEIVTGSNLCVGGLGFIHAFKTDGSGEAAGFPIRPAGFTYMNGANLADVNNDGNLELISFSYDQTFSPSDSNTLCVYSLNVPCTASTVAFGTYKGKNTRDGLITSPFSGLAEQDPLKTLKVYPNPCREFVRISWNTDNYDQLSIYNITGSKVFSKNISGKNLEIDMSKYPAGIYCIMLTGSTSIPYILLKH